MKICWNVGNEEPVVEEQKKKKLSKIIATVVLSIIIVGAVGFAVPVHRSPIYHLEYSSDASNMTVLSGQVDISGKIYGYYGKNVNSSFIDVEKIIVENKEFNNANLTIAGGDIEWQINSSINASFESAFLVFLSSWNSLNRNEMGIAIFTDENMWINATRAVIKTENCSVKIRNKNNNHTYHGDYTIKLENELENFSSIHRAEIMGLALSNDSMGDFSLSVKKSSSSMELEDLIKKFGELDENESEDTEIPSFPFNINGAAILTEGNAIIEGNRLNFTFCFCRGSFNATFNNSFSMTGKCNLILTDNGFYTDEEGYFIVPKKLIGLWPIAIGIWIMTRFIGKSSGETPKNKKLKWIALGFHILLLIMAFYLWDREINRLFGKSLIPLLISSGNEIFNASLTNPFIFIAPLELIPWSISILLIGLPIGILINSILKIWGLREGKGIGKGIGAMAIWFIGASYIIFFLNAIISPFMKMIPI